MKMNYKKNNYTLLSSLQKKHSKNLNENELQKNNETSHSSLQKDKTLQKLE